MAAERTTAWPITDGTYLFFKFTDVLIPKITCKLKLYSIQQCSQLIIPTSARLEDKNYRKSKLTCLNEVNRRENDAFQR